MTISRCFNCNKSFFFILCIYEHQQTILTMLYSSWSMKWYFSYYYSFYNSSKSTIMGIIYSNWAPELFNPMLDIFLLTLTLPKAVIYPPNFFIFPFNFFRCFGLLTLTEAHIAITYTQLFALFTVTITVIR